MNVTAIVVAALSSSVLTALISGLVNWWVAKEMHKRRQRADMIRRWRERLANYADGSADELTAMPFYAEISTVISANGIDLRGVEDRTVVVPPSQYLGDPDKRVLLAAIAQLAKKWGVE